MQISDLLGQYNNMSQSAPLKGTAGVRQLVSSLKEMSAGNIFEGTVSSVKNGQVTLALSNGQQVTARLEGKVPMTVGQSMFFQVKSNDGMQIAIKPYMIGGNSANLTLMDALSAASLPVDGRNLSMVNAMMEEQMSIDRSSLAQMAKTVNANPDIDTKTLVQMQKLDIPITPQMASRFQNYAEGKQAITKEMSAFINELPSVLVGDDLSADKMQKLGSDILHIVTEGLSEEIAIPQEVTQTLAEEAAVKLSFGEAAQKMVQDTEAGVGLPQETTQQAALDAQQETVSQEGFQTVPQTQEGGITAGNPTVTVPNTLGSILSPEQIDSLSRQLNELIGIEVTEEGESGITLSQFDSTVSVLNAIQERLADPGAVDRNLLRKLFSGSGMQALIRDALEQQWLVHPKDLEKDNKISKLYERLENQLDRMENIVRTTGQSTQHITQLAADIRNNIEFMNQINQMYTYVQIPLKMSGQNASGELFVYTNKKNLSKDNEELTAFLHLDMDHLGSTDVSVKLRGKEVFTKFYFEEEDTYRLVESHIPELESRLSAKGYHSTVTIEQEGKNVDFVEDFLKKDQPTAGMVHRYSFDMRA